MTPLRTDRARKLRQSSGRAEARVWSVLRGGRIDGHKFRRQHPIGPYFVDFACDRIRLIIEIDGGVHQLDEVIARDRQRQQALEALGWTVIRMTNDQIFSAPEILIEAVMQCSASSRLTVAPHPFAQERRLRAARSSPLPSGE